jgi:hypothetical protein
VRVQYEAPYPGDASAAAEARCPAGLSNAAWRAPSLTLH